MSKFHEKVEGRTKQIVGQMIGDDQLVREGKTQERKAEDDRSRPRRSIRVPSDGTLGPRYR